VDNSAAHHDFADMLALVQDQMRDLSAMQQKRSALTAKATAADQTVEVTVDAHCVVTEIVIDESYLSDYELADLGGHIAGAAQAAAREIGQRAASLMATLTQRRQTISARAGMLVDAPDFADVLATLNIAGAGGNEPRPEDQSEDDSQDESPYPIVRRTDV
jgi:DNA-binding protein YbaB